MGPRRVRHDCSDAAAAAQWRMAALFGKSAASRSLWIRSELKMGDPFRVGKPLSLHSRMCE